VHAALGLYLSLSLVVAVVAVFGFAEVAEDVLEGDTQRFDDGVLRWVRSHRTWWLDRIALELTALGSMVVLCTIGIIVSVLFWHLGSRRHVALIWIAASGTLVLTQAMKAAFGRPRPELEWLVDVGPWSFPSGHAMNAMVFYTVIAYAVGRIVGGVAGRTVVYALGGLVIVLVGWTRMYLGVHYPSDIVAGYALGYAWAVSCCILIESWSGSGARPHSSK
jgi:undecaprenyl-diphosphatase